MTAFSDAWRSIEPIDGWLTEAQAEALFDAARACRPGGRIVEIGSFRGRSTVALASGAGPNVEVVAIDPHAGTDRGPREIEGFEVEASDDHRRFVANLAAAGVDDRVQHLRMSSDDARGRLAGPVDVLFVDGAHRYRAARSDIGRWGDRVAPGGVMLVHDAFSSVGVTAAILRDLLWSRRFRYAGRVRSLAIYRFDPSASWRGSAARQILQLPWFAKNLLVKVLIVCRIRRRTPWPY